MENTEIKWISQRMFSYQDPSNTVLLQVCLDSGIIEEDNRNTYYSPRVLFQLIDNRIRQNSKIQIEFYFSELSQFVDQVQSWMKYDLLDIFHKKTNLNPTIVITKYNFKNKKDFSVSICFDDNNNPYFQLEILDPSASGGVSKRVIFLDVVTFNHLFIFCKQIRDNYVQISVSFLSALIQEKVLDTIRLQGIRPVIESVPRQIVDTDFREDNENSENIENSVMNYFNNLGNDIFNSDIPSDMLTSFQKDLTKEVKKVKEIEKVPMPFIGTFLNYDPKKLSEWVTAFLNANENSTAISFCPLNNIIQQCLDQEPFKINNPLFLKVQYYLDVMFKKSILNYIKEGVLISYPVFRMPKQNMFKIGTDIWALSEEILFCFIIYTNFFSSYVKYLNENSETKQIINEVIITQTFLKSYLSFFFLSMDIVDMKQLKNNLLIILEKCSKNGFLDRLNNYYSNITRGGNIDFSLRVIDPYISEFIEKISGLPSFGPESLTEVFEKSQVTNIEQIQSIEEVKKCVTTLLKFEDPKVIDERLNLFLSCIKKLVDPITINQIEAKCKKYEDLSNIFKELNLSEEVNKIKRVMDRDISLKYKSDIFNAVNKLREDPSVSETRVLFEDTLKKPENFVNVESVLEELKGEC